VDYPLVRSSFLFQMEAPLFLALDTPQRTVSEVLLCQAIIDHMNRKISTTVAKHGKTLNCLATRPQMEIAQAVSREVCPTDPYRESLEAHGRYPERPDAACRVCAASGLAWHPASRCGMSTIMQ
jgi:hypothetical protein